MLYLPLFFISFHDNLLFGICWREIRKVVEKEELFDQEDMEQLNSDIKEFMKNEFEQNFDRKSIRKIGVYYCDSLKQGDIMAP